MEDYRLIAQQIFDIQSLLNWAHFNINEDKQVLDAYEDLAVFVVENYALPDSHKNYIYDQFKIEQNHAGSLADEIRAKNKTLIAEFSIQCSIRAIEAFFSWGRPEKMEQKNLTSLKYLIAKLHGIVGDKIYKPIIINE